MGLILQCFSLGRKRITLSHAHEPEERLCRIDEYINELVVQGKALKHN